MFLENSYLGIAENDYLYAKASLEVADRINNYNNIAIISMQAAEKYFKAIIEKEFAKDEDIMLLLHSHNLRALYNRIVTKHKMMVSSRDCKWLGDFYFDAKYPGDFYVSVNKKDAMECLEILENIRKDSISILEAIDNDKKILNKNLKHMRAFQD